MSTATTIRQPLAMEAAIVSPDSDPGLIEHKVFIDYLDHHFIMELPPVIIGGLSLELAEMLRADLPNADVFIERRSYSSDKRAEVERNTEIMKRLVIKAREAEHPGDEFMLSLGRRDWAPAQNSQAKPRV